MKTALILALSLVPATAFAQGAIGVEVVYDSDPEEVGFGVNAALHTEGVVDSSRLGLSARYILIPTEEFGGVETSGTWITANVDGQYLFFKGFPALAYGIVGINLAYAEVTAEGFGLSESADALGIGLNLGAGFEYRLGNTISAFGEGKAVFPIADSEDSLDFDTRVVVAGGVRFYFGGGGGGGDMNLSDF
ncbi:MAG: hypothetical protein AAF654_01220 [Myxococcota bacterium]